MIQAFISSLTGLPDWKELEIDDIRSITLGSEVITLETRTGMEALDTVFIIDNLIIDTETKSRILSYHESGNPPAVRFFVPNR